LTRKGEIRILNLIKIGFFVAAACAPAAAGIYYVTTTGSDSGSTGPFATIGYAANAIPDDGSTILVKDGLYTGSISLTRNFTKWTNIKAENSYKAQLTNVSGGTVRIFYITGSKIILDGFEIYNQGPMPPDLSSKGEYLVHITGPAADVKLRNCILHDNYINDMIKINADAVRITYEGNVSYNQGRDLAYTSAQGFQHMDVNKVSYVSTQDNIFFNDYQDANSKTCNGSFIVCKNSSSTTFGNHDNTFQRNVFLNWQGPSDQPFLLFGEDTNHPLFYDLVNGVAQNNLFIGNSTIAASAAFNVKGCQNITFRANTVSGDLPSGPTWPFAARVCLEAGQLACQNVFFYNNIYADLSGNMTRFSMGPDAESSNVIWNSNSYWNGGNAIPINAGSNAHFPAISADTNAITTNPGLPAQGSIVLPRWNAGTGTFTSGNRNIREEFLRLVNSYGAVSAASPCVKAASKTNMPAEDILGNIRKTAPDVGCFETGSSSPTGGGGSAAENPFVNVKSFPNPFTMTSNTSKDGTIKFANLPSGRLIKLEIFDGQGVLIKSATSDITENISWDRTDLSGNLAARGIYYCVLSDENGNSKKIKVSIIK